MAIACVAVNTKLWIASSAILGVDGMCPWRQHQIHDLSIGQVEIRKDQISTHNEYTEPH